MKIVIFEACKENTNSWLRQINSLQKKQNKTTNRHKYQTYLHLNTGQFDDLLWSAATRVSNSLGLIAMIFVLMVIIIAATEALGTAQSCGVVVQSRCLQGAVTGTAETVVRRVRHGVVCSKDLKRYLQCHEILQLSFNKGLN